MKGKIINFNQETGYGTILSEDNEIYHFNYRNIKVEKIDDGTLVSFKEKKNNSEESGKEAVEIEVI